MFTKLLENRGKFLISLLMIFSFISNSVFSYLLQFVLGKYLLTPSEFGYFNSLISLLALLTIPGVAINAALVKLFSQTHSKNDSSTLKTFYFKFFYYSFFISILVFIILIVFNTNFYIALKALGNYSFILFSLYFLFSVIAFVPTAFLQGIGKFVHYSVYIMVSGFLRMFCPLFFIVFPLFNSVSDNLVFGLFLSTVLILFLVKSLIFHSSHFLFSCSFNKGARVPTYFVKDFLYILLVFFSVNFFMNFDVISVRYFLTSLDSGNYAALVNTGKVAFFGLAILTSVMYTKISYLHSSGKRIYEEMAFFSGLLILGLAFLFLIYALFARYLILILFGQSYLVILPYVMPYILFILLLSVLNFVLLFFIALNKSYLASGLIFTIIFQVILTYLNNYSLASFILNNTIVVITSLFILGITYIATEKK